MFDEIVEFIQFSGFDFVSILFLLRRHRYFALIQKLTLNSNSQYSNFPLTIKWINIKNTKKSKKYKWKMCSKYLVLFSHEIESPKNLPKVTSYLFTRRFLTFIRRKVNLLNFPLIVISWIIILYRFWILYRHGFQTWLRFCLI